MNQDIHPNPEHKRLMWHCRRGMLELDVILLPFCSDHYLSLGEEDQRRFRDLIDCEDPELFALFMGHETAQDSEHAYMVDKILTIKRETRS